MKTKVQTVIIEVGVIVGMLLLIVIGAYLVPFSQEVASANPTITYMRIPVLIMGWSVLACGLATLVMAILLLNRIRKDQIFEPKSVKLLRGIGWCAYIAILPLIALYIYTEVNVVGSITNLYVMLGMAVLFIIGLFFFMVASLFQKAVDYKEENDLTV